MTDAGWARTKPTEPGWYWWRGKEESGIALVFPADKPMPWHTSDHSARVQLFYSTGGMSSTRVNDFDGEWLGPITPDDKAQGRVAGLGEAGPILAKVCEWYEGGTFEQILEEFYAQLKLAQQAQEAK